MHRKFFTILLYPVKKLFIISIVVSLCILVFFFANFLFNAYRIDYRTLNNRFQEQIDQATQLTRKAEKFTEATALRSMSPNPFNNFYYRLDDNLQNAEYESKDHRSVNTEKNDDNINFNFDTLSDLVLKPLNNNFTIKNGKLEYEHSNANILQSIKELNIKRGDIGEIEIRMKNDRSKKMILAWSGETNIDVLNPYQNDYLAISTIPDNQFHTYLINVQNVLKGFSEPDAIIKTISLFPLNVEKETIGIDFIRLISKQSKYTKQPYGISYELKNDKMRKVIYMNSPGTMKYSIDIPSNGNLRLRFGTGVLNSDAAITFKVTAQYDDKTSLLFQKSMTDSALWQDADIDITRLSGKTATISLETISEKQNIAFWSNPILYSTPRKKFNVILVLEDALRADHLSCYNSKNTLTPVKDQFAKKGIIFQNAYSQATHTRASCPSFMTSLYPSATGVWNSGEILSENYVTLAEVMRSQGFATAMFTQNVNAGPNAGLHQGFSEIYDENISGKRVHDIYNGSLLKNWMNHNKHRNFFLYLHLLDPHGPYDPPEQISLKYRRPYIGGKTYLPHKNTLDPAWLKRPTAESRKFLYSEEVKYNDSQFEYFLNLLKKYDLTQNTLIIFIADHGEHLGEHDIWSHVPPGNEQVLHVPLIMVCPGKLPEEKKIPQPVQLLDIMPTILDLAHINKDALLIEGKSLLPLINTTEPERWNDRIVFSEEVKFKEKEDLNAFGSFFFKNWHLINSENLNDSLSRDIKQYNKKFFDHFFTTRVYDIQKDRSEQIESLNFVSDVYFHMKIQKHMNKLRVLNKKIWNALTRNENLETKYDPSTVEQLRSLGYID